VLGANDGLISTSSLLVGMAAAQAAREPVLIAGLAGLVAGALSMAAGEYVSVSSQADTERADLEQERHELAANPEAERAELAAIYVRRGLAPELAAQVAEQLSAHDALGAHARDELGISRITRARPIQAAIASAAAFAVGGVAPVLLVLLLPADLLVRAISVSTLVLLAVLGAVAARLGGASSLTGSVRVAFWGAVAMALTGLVGRLFGTAP
jgi:VIT1/CCC1 family predicted Fe2+/Mn2+ transporter